MLERAVRTLESGGRELAPPYGPGGESEGEGSLLDVAPNQFEFPPTVRASVATAIAGLRSAMQFKDEFDKAWKRIADEVDAVLAAEAERTAANSTESDATSDESGDPDPGQT